MAETKPGHGGARNWHRKMGGCVVPGPETRRCILCLIWEYQHSVLRWPLIHQDPKGHLEQVPLMESHPHQIHLQKP